MELNVRKFNTHISHNCETIRLWSSQLTDLLRNYEFNPPERPKIDRALVSMSVASRRILDLVAPLPTAGEIHGLPREATLFGDEPDVQIVDKDNPTWDFRPWFTEKATVLYDSLNKLMEYLEPEHESLDFSANATTTPLEFVKSMIRSNLAEIEGMANAILNMIRSGRITVIDVKLDDDDRS